MAMAWLDRLVGRVSRCGLRTGSRGLIFDVGLHEGEDTAFYLAKGFTVVAVEANPVLVRQAQRQFRSAIRTGRLTLLGVGVGDRRATVPFYVNRLYTEWSSFDEAIGSRQAGANVIQVAMIPFEEVVHRYGAPYYLKLDIEGYDLMALQRLALTEARPRFISAENGSVAMVELLVGMGYQHFKFVNQARVQQLQCPVPAREGREVAWTFPRGASGPFGEETPGEWTSAEQVLRAIRAIEDNANHNPDVDGWFDLHARHGQR
jgi:FkbM family methyltransferase